MPRAPVQVHPIRRSDPRRLLRWILLGGTAAGSAAIAGVIGNRTDALVVELWDWLMRQLEIDALAGRTGSGSYLSASSLDKWLGSGSKGTTEDEVSRALEDAIDNLFN